MPQELEELPLFPLNTVVFPHATLSLHIFEPRYREMIALCLDEDRPFGVVLIRAGDETDSEAEPYLVGTVVRIIHSRTYDDGRMDIQVRGERRFRIRSFDHSRAFLVGLVEPVEEYSLDTTLELQDLVEKAQEDFEALIARALSQREFSVQIIFPSDPVVLSFTIANMLEMPPLMKQRILETTDTLDRFQALIPILETHIADGQQLVESGLQPVHAKDLSEWVFPN